MLERWCLLQETKIKSRGKFMKPEDLNEEGKILNKIIYDRCIRNNKNFLMGTFGPTGSGKSYLNLRIAELWYEKYFKESFPVENVAFEPSQLTKQIKERKAKGTLRRAEVFILDDCGAGGDLGSLDFQKKAAKHMNYILQSFRSWNLVVLFNLPYFHMLNKQIRTLLHMRVLPFEVDRSRGKCYCRMNWLEYRQDKSEPLTPRIHVMVDGIWTPIDEHEFSKPSDNLIEAYEKRKDDFVSDVIDRAHEAFTGEKASESPQEDDRRELTAKQELVMKTWARLGNYKLAMEELGISLGVIYRHRKAAEKKGWRLKDFEGVAGPQNSGEVQNE